MNKLSDVFFKVFNDLPRDRNSKRIRPDVMKAFCYLMDRYTKRFDVLNPRSCFGDESIDITFYDGSSLNITAPLQRRHTATITVLRSCWCNECDSQPAKRKFGDWCDTYILAMNKLSQPCHTDGDETNAQAYRLALSLDFKYDIAKLAGYQSDPLLAC